MSVVRLTILTGVLASCFLALPAATQAGTDELSCLVGDESCYQQKYVVACTDTRTASIRRCEDWIRLLDERAGRGERAARRSQAAAYSWIGLFTDAGPDERAESRNKALAILKELVGSDASDSEAVLGLATLTDDISERVELLRQVVRLRPNSPAADSLIEHLKRTGLDRDLIEAAQIAERAHAVASGNLKWRLAADAVQLYEEAGETDQSKAFQQRVRFEVGVDVALANLSGFHGPEFGTALESATKLCNPYIAPAVGVEYCLDGLRILVPRLRGLEDRSRVQPIADSVADLIGSTAGLPLETLVAADPQWRGELLKLLSVLTSRELESARTWGILGMVETIPERKLHALERATKFAPEDFPLLWSLGAEYSLQGRLDDSLRTYRRARQFAPDETSRRMLDHNIESIVESRRSSRGGASAGTGETVR